MKKGKKIIVVILIILLVLLLTLVGYAYIALKTDLLKTSEEKFSKYLVNEFEQVSNFNIQLYEEIFERLEKESSEVTTTIGYGQDDSNVDISVKSKNDVDNKKTSIDFDVTSDEMNLLNLKLLAYDNKLGINIKDVHDKYLTIENRDLKKLTKNLDISDEDIIEKIPDEIEVSEYTELSDEEKEKIKNLVNKYYNRVFDQIKEENFSEESNVQTKNINDENIVANKYILTISKKELATIYTTTLNEILNDPEFLDLLKDRITDEELNDIKTQNNENIENINKIEDDENSIYKISVFEKNQSTVKISIEAEENTLEFFTMNTENESKIIFNIILGKDDINQVGSSTIFTLKNKAEGKNGTLVFEGTTTYNKEDIESLKNAQNNSVENETNADETSNNDLENSFSYNTFYDDSNYFDEDDYKDQTVSMTISTTAQSADVVNSKITFKDSDKENEINNLKVNFNLKFNQKLKFEELTDENSIVLNDYTKEGFSKLFEEIEQNIEKNSRENPYSLIALMWKFSNMSTITEINPSETNEDPEKLLINETKNKVNSAISLSLADCLDEYHLAAETNSEENPGNYLTLEKIKDYCETEMDIELIDGTTLKCTLDEKVFYVSIDIDGNTWQLRNVETYYSPDGTYEGIEK